MHVHDFPIINNKFSSIYYFVYFICPFFYLTDLGLYFRREQCFIRHLSLQVGKRAKPACSVRRTECFKFTWQSCTCGVGGLRMRNEQNCPALSHCRFLFQDHIAANRGRHYFELQKFDHFSR